MKIKVAIMTKAELKTEVDNLLNQVDDAFLKVVHAMLDTYVKQQEEDSVEGYDLDGNPMTAEALMNKYKAGLEAVAKGDFITIEELEEKSKEWLSSTK